MRKITSSVLFLVSAFSSAPAFAGPLRDALLDCLAHSQPVREQSDDDKFYQCKNDPRLFATLVTLGVQPRVSNSVDGTTRVRAHVGTIGIDCFGPADHADCFISLTRRLDALKAYVSTLRD